MYDNLLAMIVWVTREFTVRPELFRNITNLNLNCILSYFKVVGNSNALKETGAKEIVQKSLFDEVFLAKINFLFLHVTVAQFVKREILSMKKIVKSTIW